MRTDVTDTAAGSVILVRRDVTHTAAELLDIACKSKRFSERTASILDR